MSLISDPHQQRVSDTTRDHTDRLWQEAQQRAFLERIAEDEIAEERSSRRRRGLGVALAVGIALFALTRFIGPTSSTTGRTVGDVPPANVPAANGLASGTSTAAPLWNIEITSATDQPVTALVYDEQSGISLIRVPAAGASKDEIAVIGARLARGDVRIISLGRSSLKAHSVEPGNAPSIKWSATGRIITAYQHKDATGVRMSW